jgi:hypothetical protein
MERGGKSIFPDFDAKKEGNVGTASRGPATIVESAICPDSIQKKREFIIQLAVSSMDSRTWVKREPSAS